MFFRIIVFIFISIHFTYASDCVYVNNNAELDAIIHKNIMKQNGDAIDVELSPFSYLEIKENSCVKNVTIDNRNFVYRALVNIEEHNRLYQGKYNYSVLIPVLKYDITRNQIISEKDIIMIAHPINKLTNNTIMTKEELIGMSAKLNIKADKPIYDREIYKPIMVRKGEQVEVVCNKSNLSIKIIATSLENGSFGDMIKLKNNKSKAIISGKIVGDKTVFIR